MKKTKKKLTLTRESVRVLNDDHLRSVDGAGQGGTAVSTMGPTGPSCNRPTCPGVNTCESCGTCTSANCVLSAFYSCWC